jgi:hypothetical protein
MKDRMELYAAYEFLRCGPGDQRPAALASDCKHGWYCVRKPSESPLKALWADGTPEEPGILGPFETKLEAQNCARRASGLKERVKPETSAQKRRRLEYYDRQFRSLFGE